MAVSVTLYTFSKANNSTAIPTSDIVNLQTQGVFKEGADILAPSIGFDFGSALFNPAQFNYAYCLEFGRYYFISDWRYYNRLWYADMTLDALGTYATSIKASTQYVTRSASSYNGHIIDNQYPLLTNVTIDTQVLTPYTVVLTEGYYVLGIVNSETTATGICYYIMDAVAYSALRNAIYNDVEWANITDIGDELTKAVINPAEYVVSLKWFPFEPPHGNIYTTVIKLGFWSFTYDNSNHRVYVLSSSPVVTKTSRIAITKHPQLSTKGAFVKSAAYSNYSLMVLPFGTFNLDAQALYNATILYIIFIIDCVSGTGTIKIYAGTSTSSYAPVTNATAQFAVSLPFASVVTDLSRASTTRAAIAGGVQLAKNAVGAAKSFKQTYQGIAAKITNAILGEGSVETSNNYEGTKGSVAETAESIGDGIVASASKSDVTGSAGSLTAFYTDSINLVSTFVLLGDSDNTHFGRPLCASTLLSTLSGYTVCSGVKIDFPCTDTERAAITEVMENGFYLE